MKSIGSIRYITKYLIAEHRMHLQGLWNKLEGCYLKQKYTDTEIQVGVSMQIVETSNYTK